MSKKSIVYVAAAAVVLIIAVLVVLFACGDIGSERDTFESDSAATEVPTVSPTPTPTPEPIETAEPTEPPEIENTIAGPQGMVFAGDKLSFGLATGGMLSYVGSNEGQAYCYNWRDIIRIAGNGSATIGLTDSREVLISSSDESICKIVSEWKDVVDIAVSDTVIYGLCENGDVLSTDGSTDDLHFIRQVAAGSDFLLAVTGSGDILTVGNAPDVSSFTGHEIIDISAGNAHAVALTVEGTLLTTESENPFASYTGVQKVFASDDDTAIIDSEGNLCANCEFIDEPIENAIDFSCGYGHALVLLDDGSVLAFGDNEYMQCEVDSWRLRPYADENGYILGIKVGETDPDGGIIKTGDTYTLDNGTEGIAIILGDVNMDGHIDESDLELVGGFIEGKVELTEIQKQAANLLRDANKPNSIDAADSEHLVYHLNGFAVIDQYAKPFTYSGEVADAERFNPDTVGYISIEHTNIIFPLMYGENFYYHYHNPAGVATSRSSIYLYYPTPTKNIIISGHNLRQSGLMLHDLHKLQDRHASGYNVFKNRIWTVNVYGETHYWEVFAMYEEKPSKPWESSQYYNTNYNYTMDSLNNEEILEWIDYQIERTELNYTIHVTENDQFMTLLTCSDYHWESELGGRIYFFLRRMDGH